VPLAFVSHSGARVNRNPWEAYDASARTLDGTSERKPGSSRGSPPNVAVAGLALRESHCLPKNECLCVPFHTRTRPSVTLHGERPQRTPDARHGVQSVLSRHRLKPRLFRGHPTHSVVVLLPSTFVVLRPITSHPRYPLATDALLTMPMC
jgi:hypothetical protein